MTMNKRVMRFQGISIVVMLKVALLGEVEFVGSIKVFTLAV